MVIDVKKNRYINRCSCEQLRRRPLTLNIISIIKEANKKQVTIKDIIKVGRIKYRNWPKDRDTVFRALKTMSKCEFVVEKKRGKGQATIWQLNKDKILMRELMLHEIKQLENVISRLPHWAFEVEYFREEIKGVWQRIRTSLVEVEKQDVAFNWILFDFKEREFLRSSSYSLLDKQLSIILLFCLFSPSREMLYRWFDLSQLPFSVKADFELAGIFKKHFYQRETRSKLVEKLNKHELDHTLSEKLVFLIKIYLGTFYLDYEYSYQLFDKNKFSLLGDTELEKHNKAISNEKARLYLEKLAGKKYD